MSRSVRSVLVALALGGCTAEIAEPVSAELTGSVGVLDVERVADGHLAAGRTAAAGRTELTAAFARYRGVEGASVLAVLGSRSPAELESCVFVGADDAIGDAGTAGDAEWGEVELLDVGTIQVRVAGSEASLAPRAFPDLASVIAGVFYAGDAELAVPVADVDEYTFRAAGSADVPAFDAVVPAPADPADVRLDGFSASEAPLTSIREAGLDVAWASGDARDVLEVEIRSGGDLLACAARDDGAFRIERESLATLAPDAAASMIVRRVRVSPVDVPGLDDAFARIAVARELALELR